jgi:hypothetical protein
MSYDPAMSFSIALACLALASTVSLASAQVTVPARPAPDVSRPADSAREAMRREAEAERVRREQAFERLHDLKPAIQPEVRIGPAGIPLFRVVDEQDQEADPDENAPAEPRFVVAEETFDRWLLGSTGDTDSARAYLESLLQRKVDDINQVRKLSPAQRKKLILAGRGDIKRLFDRIEDERKEFHRLRTDADQCGEFLRELQPLRVTIRQGPFDFGSIFAKTLKKMLDEGQLARRSAS